MKSHGYVQTSASASEIIRTIEKCPSGALSYKVGGTRYQQPDRSPAVKVAKNGPLEVVGGIVLHDDKGKHTGVPGALHSVQVWRL